MFSFGLAYAMAQSAQGVGGTSSAHPLAGFIPILLIFAVFYFILIRPQMRQQKQHQQMLSRLNKNDEVVTNGGMHGTIVNVDEKTITLRVDDNTRIKFQKSAVSYVKKRAE